MKLLVCFYLIASSLVPPTERVKKNNDVEITAKIKSSLKTGNAKELVLLFDKDVELLIDGEKVEFPKIKNTHAEQILKSFFKKRPPRDFQFVYQGNASSIRYSTGTYQSGNDSYLVYILMKATEGRYLIETLQFRKELPNKTAKL